MTGHGRRFLTEFLTRWRGALYSSRRSSSIQMKPNRLIAGGLSLWRTNDARAANTPHFGPAVARDQTEYRQLR